MTEFESDRSALLKDLEISRAELLGVVEAISPDQFASARRGSWTVSKIIDHVVGSERLYTQLISALGGAPAAAGDQVPPLDSAAASATALASTRRGLLDAAGTVAEDDFYQLKTIGHEEYSVLSILENVAAHDREHAEQIRKTIES